MSYSNEETEKIEVETDTVSIEVTEEKKPDEVLLPIRRLILSGTVDDSSISYVINKIIKINEDETAERIDLYLATHGGGIDMGIGLFDVIKMSPIPVDTIVVGCAMSMGSTLLQAGVKRYAMKNSTIMIHPARGGGVGRMEEAKEQIKNGLKLERRNNKLVADRVGMSLKEYLKFMGDAKYMSPKTALRHNFIDGIKETW